MKWGYLGRDPSQKARFAALHETLLEQKLESDFQVIELADDFEGQLKSLIGTVEVLRVDPSVGEQFVKQLHHVTVKEMFVRTTTCLVAENEVWWSRPLMIEPLQDVLQGTGQINIAYEVLIVGIHAYSWIALETLSQMGFTKFAVIDRDDLAAARMLRDFQKKHFSLTFRTLRSRELMNIPENFSMVVNCSPQADEGLLQDLSYFNFLVEGGIVVDARLYVGESEFIESARQVGAVTRNGLDITVGEDDFWVKRFFGQPLSQTYAQKLKFHLEQVQSLVTKNVTTS